MTSITPTGPKARSRPGHALGLRALWLATAAAATLVTPAAMAQQPTAPPPDEEPVVTAPEPPPEGAQPAEETPAPATTPPQAQPPVRPGRSTQERQLADTRGFSLTPTLGLEAAVTDNVLLTDQDRKSDFLARALLRLDSLLNHGRTVGRLTVEGFYDWYARTSSFNGASVNADGDASLSLVPDVLSLDVHGVVTNGRTTTFGSPAIDRAGVDGRLQVAVWDIGPRLTTKLGDFADLQGVARFSQVYYWGASGSQITTPIPQDDNIVQVVGRIDTGKRMHGYELLTIAQFEKDEHGYQQVNAVQSLYVNVDPAVRLIGRAGYERVEQQNISTIDAPLLSAGFEFTPNDTSRITIEGGERFHRGAWSAQADVSLADHLYLAGQYSEAVQPDQVFVANSFQEFVQQSMNLPLPIAPQRFQVQDNLYSQASFNKVGDLRVLLRNPRTSLELTGRYTDREFLTNHTHDRTALAMVTLKHALRRDLDGSAEFSYSKTYESPLYGASRTYAVNATLDYRANSTTDVTASYAFANGKELFTGGRTINDNTLLLALRKRF